MNENSQHIEGLLEQPRCARCEYDLTGEVASWKGSCPVAGVCSECGLEFLWADALRADRQRLGWLYEHAEHWWDVRRAWGTAVRALFPWQFWKSVQPHHEVVMRRLLIWLGILFISVGVIGAILRFGLASAAQYSVSRTFFGGGWTPRLSFIIEEWAIICGFIFLFSSGFMLTNIMIPSLWSGVPVRAVHIVRIGVYSIIPGMFLYLAAAFLTQWYTVSMSSASPKWASASWVTAWWDALGRAAMILSVAWTIAMWSLGLSRGMSLSSGRTTVSVIFSFVIAILGIFTTALVLETGAIGQSGFFIVVLAGLVGFIGWRWRASRAREESAS